jgi:hypothetical protein
MYSQHPDIAKKWSKEAKASGKPQVEKKSFKKKKK